MKPKATPQYTEGPAAWANFQTAMRKVLTVSHAEIQQRIANERERSAQNPHKRGPKRKP